MASLCLPIKLLCKVGLCNPFPGTIFFSKAQTWNTAAQIQSQVHTPKSIIVSPSPYKYFPACLGAAWEGKGWHGAHSKPPNHNLKFLLFLLQRLIHMHSGREGCWEFALCRKMLTKQIPQPYIIEKSRLWLTQVYENQTSILNSYFCFTLSLIKLALGSQAYWIWDTFKVTDLESFPVCSALKVCPKFIHSFITSLIATWKSYQRKRVFFF